MFLFMCSVLLVKVKPLGIECLARIRNEREKLEGNYKKYAFNLATIPSDIFGTETFIDGEVKLIDGPLTEFALNGQTFIADEMNLSSNNTMLSLIPIFNTIRNRLIYFPGLQTPIKINFLIINFLRKEKLIFIIMKIIIIIVIIKL